MNTNREARTRKRERLTAVDLLRTRFLGLLNPNVPEDISQKWTAILEPRFVLELARLLNKLVDRAAARAEYQRFLDLWKQADPGLPELKEARRQLGEL